MSFKNSGTRVGAATTEASKYELHPLLSKGEQRAALQLAHLIKCTSEIVSISAVPAALSSRYCPTDLSNAIAWSPDCITILECVPAAVRMKVYMSINAFFQPLVLISWQRVRLPSASGSAELAQRRVLLREIAHDGLHHVLRRD